MNPNWPNSIQLSFSRGEIGLGPLVIGPGPGGTYLVTTEGGVEDPNVRWEKGYARRNRNIDGGTLVSATKNLTEVTHQITIRGTSAVHLRAAKDVLMATVEQFQFTLTETIDGVPQTWSCDPADYDWVKNRALRANHAAVMNLVIPVHPEAS